MSRRWIPAVGEVRSPASHFPDTAATGWRGTIVASACAQVCVERLHRLPNVKVRTNTTVVGVEGHGRLEEIVIQNVKTGKTER